MSTLEDIRKRYATRKEGPTHRKLYRDRHERIHVLDAEDNSLCRIWGALPSHDYRVTYGPLEDVTCPRCKADADPRAHIESLATDPNYYHEILKPRSEDLFKREYLGTFIPADDYAKAIGYGSMKGRRADAVYFDDFDPYATSEYDPKKKP